MEYSNFERYGYLYLEDFFPEALLQSLEGIICPFHERWMAANEAGYRNGLINSHSLTSDNALTAEERLALFRFLSQDRILEIVKAVFPGKALFLNTQLFFDPNDGTQPNYWHRDIQYTGLSREEQQMNIESRNVVHFRIPLRPEAGIEVIPGTHRIWDLPEEEAVRLSLNGHKPSDALQRGLAIPLKRGDLLVFSANMVHRGLYGGDRFAFDIIFCDDTPEFSNFIDLRNHPSGEELAFLNPAVFMS